MKLVLMTLGTAALTKAGVDCINYPDTFYLGIAFLALALGGLFLIIGEIKDDRRKT